MLHKNYKKVYTKNYRILCFDYGVKYVGLAIGCVKTKLINALPTIKQTNIKHDKNYITKLCAEHNVGSIVVGSTTKKICPAMQKKIKIFHNNLLVHKLPVHLENELLTTKLVGKNVNKQLVHGTSACLILQMWLNKVKNY